MREWAKEWEATLVGVRTTTRERDLSMLRNHVLTRFGDLPLSRVEHIAVVAWVADLSKRLAPSSVHKCHQILAKLLDAAVNARKLQHNVARGVRLPQVSREEQRFLDPTQVAALADAIDARYRHAVLLMALISRPGADARKPEILEVEKVVEDLGLSLNRIHAPGTLDGGDVLKVGSTVYVGRGGRTNSEGVKQLRAILGPLGAAVVAVPLTKVLHLKSAVTALPDGSIVGYEPLIDDLALLPRFVAVPEGSGAHVVLLGGDKLLMAADCPRSADLFVDLGYEPVLVDISELQKLEGCVTCLSVRLRDSGR